MRNFIALVVVFLLGVAGAGMLAAGAREPTAADWARQEAEIARIERTEAAARAAQPAAEIVAAIWPLVPFGAAVCVLVYLGGLGYAHVYRVTQERQPDGRGLLPVTRAQLSEVAPQALGAYHGARQIEAARQPVPQTVTYAPHNAPRVDYRGGDALPGAELPEAGAALPGLTDLAALAFRPSAEAILLGLAEGGERITVPARALCHVALVGATGGGKSNLLRLLVPQLQAMGARVVLADPHYAPFDPGTGEDWRQIAARLHIAPAVSPDEIGGALAYLGEELDRRLELRRAGKRWGPPVFLALDELPVIADTVPNSPENLGRLLREGRKVGVYTVGAAQSFLVKVIGGDSSAREAYRTAFYVGGDLKSAAALLDVPQREIAEGAIGAGVAYLRSAATSPARLVRVPYASNSAIAGLLGAASAPTSGPASEPTSSGPEGGAAEVGREVGREVGSGGPLPAHQGAANWTAEEVRILEALRSGKRPGEVAQAIAGCKGGRKFDAATEQVAEVIRRALG